MQGVTPHFRAKTSADPRRFDEFSQWGCPGGIAGFDSVHEQKYDPRDPWFSMAPQRLKNNDKVARLPFVKFEHRARARQIFIRTRSGSPKIIEPEAMIGGERFLAFAKAYINVMVIYRNLRGLPKTQTRTLVLIEWALRQLNSGANDPSLMTRATFALAERKLISEPCAAGVKYDIGCELSMLAGMLQGGYHSKNFRYGQFGFGLLAIRFTFTSTVPMPVKRKAQLLDDDMQTKNQSKRLPNEVVTAIGLAYRSAQQRFGRDHEVTAMAALAALPFTTVSMRLSDLLQLRADALRRFEGKVRLSIYRPKIDLYQELPVPRQLETLAEELSEVAADYSSKARAAFKYYIERFESFEKIDELYIPEDLQSHFGQAYFRRPVPGGRKINGDAPVNAFEMEALDRPSLYQKVSTVTIAKLSIFRGVDTPKDFFPAIKFRAQFAGRVYLSRTDLSILLQSVGVRVPDEIRQLSPNIYVDRDYLFKSISADEGQKIGIELAFLLAGRNLAYFSSVEKLRTELLADFKKKKFSHWPYTSSDRKLRLDEALCVWFDAQIDHKRDFLIRKRAWWRPVVLTHNRFIQWTGGYADKPPRLFEILDIRLSNGEHPTFTLHDARAYLQTRALTLGVSEQYIDLLAGRTSGPQSAHYDLRTPAEIVSNSIEGFDPAVDFKVIGPVADSARTIEVVDRKIFLFERAVPKQLTEVGGCSTSWSLNPCEQHGDCMRCGLHVWMKGDKKRLPIIKDMHQHSVRMIAEGHRRLRSSTGLKKPIERHIRQHESVRLRCEEIFAVENDPSITPGTIVTFEAAPEALGLSELTSRLHDENVGVSPERDDHGNVED
ncbi:hypothetical protein ACSFBM_21475 [Variovorax sp. GB1R11]|uniref:hypothetical protein n=1 Tax=Variovorax sp. GB1R11 TaxID=3443741 RepID=UPI003F44C703